MIIRNMKRGSYHYGNAKKYDENNKYPAMWKNFDKNWTYFKNGKMQDESSGTSNVINDGIESDSEKEGLIWERENGSEGSMSGSSQGSKDTQFKQSYWYHDYGTTGPKAGDWVNPEYYNLLFGKKDIHFGTYYWLACRSVYLHDDYCDFGIHLVRADSRDCFVRGAHFYESKRRNEHGW